MTKCDTCRHNPKLSNNHEPVSAQAERKRVTGKTMKTFAEGKPGGREFYNMKYIRNTAKAVMLSHHSVTNPQWLPFSQINISWEEAQAMGEGELVSVSIPDWLAAEKQFIADESDEVAPGNHAVPKGVFDDDDDDEDDSQFPDDEDLPF